MFRGWTEAPASAPSDAFLDTIPEDQSVAQQKVKNLSAASAVASSDSGIELDPDDVEEQPMRTTRKAKRAASVASSSNNAIIDTADTTRGVVSSPSPGPHSPDRYSKDDANAGRRWWCWVLWTLMLTGMCVGVYYIVKHSTEGRHGDDSTSRASGGGTSSLEPTLELTFPPGIVLDLTSDAPTMAPSPSHIQEMDEILMQISSADAYLDPSTPQGECRDWLWKEDQLQLRKDIHGEESIQQRYILCVFYHATNGQSWRTSNVPFLDPTMHECDWSNVGCNSDDQVATLYFTERNLQGTIPTEMIHLSHLQLLNLGENQLTGRIPQGLLELPDLILIDLSSNQLTGTIPSTATSPTTLGRYSPLEVLYLDGNRFEGTVPFFDTLHRMRVQKNLFTGFDPGYATLQTLTSWKMYDNRFQGPLPQEWDAPNLSYIDLALNQWTGTIPESLWNLPSLVSLALHDAQLTGTLPSQTASTSWKYLLLYSNQLSGSIPTGFAQDWINVTSILLHNNSLVGEITQDQCDQWPLMTRLETDCLRTELQCDCCTVCHV
mmetsp:Transcript_57335/g.166431  ORF Transcript_57335/g.166431 Transcript_57335/m.166431 type:complete len:548 (+) Transcript_57335:142-1785(+)